MLRPIIQKKAEAVNELQEKFVNAKTIVAFDYPGLTVAQFTKLRSLLREAHCEVAVYKNNISRRAAIAAGQEDFAELLVGAKALAISFDDVVAPAKIVYDFARENKVVKIHAGIIEGKFADQEHIMRLATLPSRDTLLTMLAVGMLTPVRELAIGLNMISEQ